MIGRTKLGTKQVLAAKNVKRHVAILLVVALKEPTKLVAVDRIVGRVEVENDPRGRCLMGFEKEIGQERFHLAQVGRDLLVAAVLVGPRRREFESIERALAGQRLAAIPLSGTILSGGVLLTDQHGQERIVPQLVMVVKIFVAKRQAVDSLGNQVFDRVFGQFRDPVIGEATGESIDDSIFRFDFPQQQCPGIGRDGPAVKASQYFPLPEGLKTEPLRVTLCLHRITSLCVI